MWVVVLHDGAEDRAWNGAGTSRCCFVPLEAEHVVRFARRVDAEAVSSGIFRYYPTSVRWVDLCR